MKKDHKHYRDLAIQTAEEYGALLCESFLEPEFTLRHEILEKRASETFAKMMEYVRLARRFVPTPDYET